MSMLKNLFKKRNLVLKAMELGFDVRFTSSTTKHNGRILYVYDWSADKAGSDECFTNAKALETPRECMQDFERWSKKL